MSLKIELTLLLLSNVEEQLQTHLEESSILSYSSDYKKNCQKNNQKVSYQSAASITSNMSVALSRATAAGFSILSKEI